MHAAFLFIPIISAAAFWLVIKLFIRYFFRPVAPFKIAGLSFQGILPKNQEQIAKSFAAAVSKELMGSNMLRQKLAGPETLEKALPVIETHIDNFLNVKLKASLPVITMFIGERVTNQLKELFMKELEELFPSVMIQFIDGLENNKEIENEIALKIAAVPVARMEEFFYSTVKNELKKIELGFALAGLITGIVQVIFLLLFL